MKEELKNEIEYLRKFSGLDEGIHLTNIEKICNNLFERLDDGMRLLYASERWLSDDFLDTMLKVLDYEMSDDNEKEE